MTRAEFAARVQAHEAAAARNPAGYKNRVVLFAALGYAFIVVMVVGTLSLLALMAYGFANGMVLNTGTIKIAAFLAIFLVILLRSLWVKFEKPEGIEISPQVAPQLHETVNRMTAALGAPRFHRILLDEDFNAAAVQYPRLGILGWPENYLVLGLPLMQALSREQLEAVVGHELGHLRGGHGAFGAWIYRVNATWVGLLSQMKQGGGILGAFFSWYYPRFNALTFVLRRQDEYEADRCSAELTSAITAGEALSAVQIRARFVQEGYWKGIYEGVRVHSTPPATAFTDLRTVLRQEDDTIRDRSRDERYLQEALREETGYSDTHPALRDRLKSLGVSAALSDPPAQTAADYFLGAHVERLARQLDSEWRVKVGGAWKAGHERAQAARAELATLNARVERGETLLPAELWKRADWTEDFDGEDAALPLFRELLDNKEAQVVAHFAVGRILIGRDDPEGVTFLNRAMTLDYEATLPALGLIYEYHKRRGDEAAAKAVYEMGMSHADRQDEAADERSTVGTAKTRYLEHGLDEATIADLARQLNAIPQIKEAYLVRKELALFSEKPLYVLGVTLTGYWKSVNAETDTINVLRQMQAGIDFSAGDSLYTVLHGQRGWLHPVLKKVPNALIYRRK